ncbi:MAG TPA: hypothetical protein VF746_09010 [Longimicrobium sp.]|jgi:hypothetical protein
MLRPRSRRLGAALGSLTLAAGIGLAASRGPSHAVAAPPPPASTRAAVAVHTCQPVDVAAFANRVHVLCSVAAPGGFVFFAVSTANTAHANRLLSVLMMAHLTGRKVKVGYDPADTSGTAFGCQASDCRRLLSVAVI